MEREKIDSTNISEIGYDAETFTLEVCFNNGRVYQYFDVPQHVWEAFKSSASKGQFLNSEIKGRFRYARV